MCTSTFQYTCMDRLTWCFAAVIVCALCGCVRMILFFTYTRFVCTINKRLKDYKFSSFACFLLHLFYLFHHLPASLLRCLFLFFFLSRLHSFSLIKQFLNLRFYSIFFGSKRKRCFVVALTVAVALSRFSSHRWFLLSLLRSFVVVVVISFSFFLLQTNLTWLCSTLLGSRARYRKVGQLDFNSWCINIHSNHHRHMWVCSDGTLVCSRISSMRFRYKIGWLQRCICRYMFLPVRPSVSFIQFILLAI